MTKSYSYGRREGVPERYIPTVFPNRNSNHYSHAPSVPNTQVVENLALPEVLCDAAKRGDMKIIEYYLTEGEVPLDWRHKIACIGAEQNNINLLHFMVKRNPGIVNYVFKHAVEYGALDAVHYLIETQNVSIPPLDASRILEVVVEKGHLNILKYFIEVGNISIDTSTDESSQCCRRCRPLLFRAVQHKRYNIAEYLIEERKANLSMLDFEDQNILYTAAYNCDLKFIKYVLDEKKANVDVNQKNKAGKTLLLKVACWWDCFEVLEYLVEQKQVNINNTCDRSTGSPLHCVHSAKICAFLLERGVDVNGRDIDGDTPLHRILCTMRGDRYTEEYERIFNYLIERGANVNLRNKFDASPLYYASLLHHNYAYKICKCLIERGADIKLANGYLGSTPLHGIIESYGSRGWDLPPRVPPDIINLLEYLIEHGADINQANHDGETPLHHAAKYENYEICKYLIEKGANRQIKDKRGKTPVELAFNEELVKYMRSAPVSSEQKSVNRPRRAINRKKRSFSNPECSVKFVRARKSAAILYSALSPSTDIYRGLLKISSNHSLDVNLSSSFSGLYRPYFPGFLAIAQLLMKNGNTSSTYPLVTEDRAWSLKTILASKMDPLAEDVINEIQF